MSAQPYTTQNGTSRSPQSWSHEPTPSLASRPHWIRNTRRPYPPLDTSFRPPYRDDPNSYYYPPTGRRLVSYRSRSPSPDRSDSALPPPEEDWPESRPPYKSPTSPDKRPRPPPFTNRPPLANRRRELSAPMLEPSDHWKQLRRHREDPRNRDRPYFERPFKDPQDFTDRPRNVPPPYPGGDRYRPSVPQFKSRQDTYRSLHEDVWQGQRSRSSLARFPTYDPYLNRDPYDNPPSIPTSPRRSFTYPNIPSNSSNRENMVGFGPVVKREESTWSDQTDFQAFGPPTKEPRFSPSFSPAAPRPRLLGNSYRKPIRTKISPGRRDHRMAFPFSQKGASFSARSQYDSDHVRPAISFPPTLDYNNDTGHDRYSSDGDDTSIASSRNDEEQQFPEEPPSSILEEFPSPASPILTDKIPESPALPKAEEEHDSLRPDISTFGPPEPGEPMEDIQVPNHVNGHLSIPAPPVIEGHAIEVDECLPVKQEVTDDQQDVVMLQDQLPTLEDAQSISEALRIVVMTRLRCDRQTREEIVNPIILANRSIVEPPSAQRVPCAEDLVSEFMTGDKLRKRLDSFDNVKASLVKRFEEHSTKLVEKVRGLREEYMSLHERWLAHCAQLDLSNKVTSQEETVVAPSGRSTRRSTAIMGDAVRSDLEFERVVASLGIDDATDPDQLATRNLATIPDMISVTHGQVDYVFDDTNHRVDNPSEFYCPQTGVDDWTQDEKEIFMRTFAAYPKQFGIIAGHLRSKSQAQCVNFYYLHKKLPDFRPTLARYAPAKRRRRRTEKPRGHGILADIRQHDDEVARDGSAANETARNGSAANGVVSRRRRPINLGKPPPAHGESTPSTTPPLDLENGQKQRRRRTGAIAQATALRNGVEVQDPTTSRAMGKVVG